MSTLPNKTFIGSFFLVLMCIQYVPLEGIMASNYKFGAMCLSPVLWMLLTPRVSKAFVWGGAYFCIVLIASLSHFESFRMATVGYLLSFICTFILFYNCVHIEKAFTLTYFIKLLKGILLAFTLALLVQQAVRLAGMGPLEIINLHQIDPRSPLTVNSLSIEQSHMARVMTVLMLCLLRAYEAQWGRSEVSLSRLFSENRWVMIGFTWSMLSVGSGTAIVGLCILSLYFLKRRYALTLMPLLLALYISLPYIEYEPLQRATATLDAAKSLDQKSVIKADHSAAARVVPLINSVTGLDLTRASTWLGQGVDSGKKSNYLGKYRTVGGIAEYGFLSYLFSLVFIYICCIKHIVSLESLILFFMLGAGLGNVAYLWGCLMLFSASRFFMANGKEDV